MPSPKKRRKAVKKSGTQRGRVAKKRGTTVAKKRGTTAGSKSLVMSVVHSLEEIPTKIRKNAKKRRKVASRRVLNVVHKLEEIPAKIRKAAKKKGWRVA